MSSPYEDLSRFEKALKLADALDGAGFGSSAVAKFQPGQWRMAARLAGVSSEPSKQTQDCVIVMLRNREGVRRIMKNLSAKVQRKAAHA